MSLASQVVCSGFVGTSGADAPLQQLAELGIGTVILFARNVQSAPQTARLTAALRDTLGGDTPALVAVDQEGGHVARLHDGAVELPAMMALGATGDPELAHRAGRRLGADLRALGIGLDFAPVLDLAVNARNTVIGSRSFGEDPNLVAAMGLAFAHGIHDGGAIAVGKHFPGHGATHVDSHNALPVLDLDEARWRTRDLVPFAAAAQELAAIMCAHVVLPALDREYPATLSRRIVTGILREELGFAGVIFSDCLEMAALGVPPAQSAPRAIAAGIDCVVISHHLDNAATAIAAIDDAVRDGTLPRRRLEEAAERMARLRATVPATVNFDGDRKIGIDIARRAVRVLRGSISISPQEPVSVVSFESGDRPSLSAELRRRGIKSEIMRVPLQPRDDDVELLEMILRAAAGRPVVIVIRRAHLHPGQLGAARRLLQSLPDAIVISAREPYDAEAFEDARNLACIFDDGVPSMEGLADVMTGRSATVR